MAIAPAEGAIDPGTLYTIREIQRRLRIGDAALRRWRRGGLRILYVGRTAYVKGEDVIRYLETSAKESR